MDVRKYCGWHAQQIQQLRIPLTHVDVVEERARSIRGVGDVRAVAGEMPDEPGIDGAEGELAALGARSRAGNMVQEPGDLGAAEIRIYHQAGALAHQTLGTG